MKIIYYLLCWFKARFGTLSFEDFRALCDSFENTKNAKIAKKALATYFARNTPQKNELKRIYAGGYELRWLYLENIPRSRFVTDEEQHLMVTSMPIGGPYNFPSALRKPALKELFDSGQAQKIGDYVRDFTLPPDYELRLIELCRTERQPHYLNSYRRALEYYLKSVNGKKLTSPDVQLAVLALDDEELTVAMVGNCNMSENILFLPALRILVEQGSLNSLKKLLFNSFIESEELVRIMLERYPRLERIYDISYLRRPLYKLERETNQFWGTVAPTMEEHKFIMHTVEQNVRLTKRPEYVHNCVLPMLADPKATPYFCAWCADNYPEISEQAYQRVRQIAKFYRDRCKK